MSKAESCPIFGRKDSVPVRPSVPCFFSFFFFLLDLGSGTVVLYLAGGMVALF